MNDTAGWGKHKMKFERAPGRIDDTEVLITRIPDRVTEFGRKWPDCSQGWDD